jgi:DNA mismatch repair protein MutS
MRFDIDKQTIKDLELFPEKRNDKSILSVYNQTATVGGREFLFEVFSSPVTNQEFLQNRKKEINFFVNNNCSIALNSGQLAYIEYYIRNQRAPLRNNIIDATADGVRNILKPDSDYFTISEGLLHIIRLFVKLNLFIDEARLVPIPETLECDFERLKTFISSKSLKKVLTQSKDLSYSQINSLDYFLRVQSKNEFREALDIVYKIDVLQTLSKLMKNDGFTLPEYCSDKKTSFEVTDAIHPLLTSPIPNSFSFKQDSNLCFITGPNMSGKSTFLKTMGLMIYLAHIGFPVPAKRLSISLFDGLFTTINLTDNLNQGYSHFYSEVKRVKDLVIKIDAEKKLFIIFDELFRGTNVKDAYDASLIILSALAKIQNNLFFISTHILEVAESIDNKDSIMFRCFESELIEQKPVYDFKIKNGISKERIGLLIIKNENIIEILDKIVSKQKKLPIAKAIKNGG